MKRRRYQPWRKGPATILRFPVPPVRCWWVHQLPCGGWRGEIVGSGVDGPPLTGTGDLAQVLEVLRQPEHRAGLPIVVASVAIAAGVAA